MVVLTSAGARQTKPIEAAQVWMKAHLQSNLDLGQGGDRALQTDLWHLWKSQSEASQIALLCLRCWVSHQIAAACYQLAAQFGENYGFAASDLWPLVLDDDGRLAPRYQSLSMKIVERYDPTQAALSTWANRMTKGHSEINQFCLERGLYRISDWALLNDISVQGLASALSGLSAGELKEKAALLEAYHRVYRRDRILYRQKQGRASRCQDPTVEQLQEISAAVSEAMPRQSPAAVLSALSELAAQVRSHRVSVRRGMPMTTPLDAVTENHQVAGQYDQQVEEEQVAQDDFVGRYRSHFLSSLDEAIVSVTQGYTASYQKKKSPKGGLFLSALTLFHCEGMSMGAIAKEIGLSSQVQVTRLLKLKRFRTEVCAYWFNQLKQQVETEALQFIAPDRLAAIAGQLESVLSEETEAVMSEAAAEAQISKNRGTESTFAKRLCAKVVPMSGTFLDSSERSFKKDAKK